MRRTDTKSQPSAVGSTYNLSFWGTTLDCVGNDMCCGLPCLFLPKEFRVLFQITSVGKERTWMAQLVPWKVPKSTLT